MSLTSTRRCLLIGRARALPTFTSPPARRRRSASAAASRRSRTTRPERDDTREALYGILRDDQRKRFENDLPARLRLHDPGRGRFRVNVYRSARRRRGLPPDPEVIPKLDTLDLPAVLGEFARKPRGLILVTGPTGSGKSTTLAAMLDQINETRDEHIMTVEDPIEFLHMHKRCLVNQREIGADADVVRRRR